jgi:polygalacturonase
MKRLIVAFGIALLALPLAAAEFNVRNFGARGDGINVDSPAINAAVDAAASKGGGTVVLPPGTYLSFSIRLKSNITLRIEAGATLLAATPSAALGQYDVPEPNDWGDRLQYQDYGHSHWHNSLIWGEDLKNVAIVGRGLINGKALLRNATYSRGSESLGPNGTFSVAQDAASAASIALGQGNKAIALKNSSDVVIRDISILTGGHFAILVTAVDRLTIEGITIDTNRDGIDIDASQHVRIRNCRVNSPNDDAIVLKSSFALGYARATEDVTVDGCTVSGYDEGTLLDGTHGRTNDSAPDHGGPTARIKIGTESNGAFRNISIHDCVFERSRGLAIESVDGSVIEDVVVHDLTMREVTNPPIFVRLGNRARGPASTVVGRIHRVKISHITAEDADSRYSAILLSGLPGHPIEDLTLQDIRIAARGGLTPDIIAEQSGNLVSAFFLRGAESGAVGPREPMAVPEREKAYPEPSMFGLLPAGAIYARHVRNLRVLNTRVSFAQADTRPKIVLDDVAGVRFDRLEVTGVGTPAFVLRNVRDFSVKRSAGLRDTTIESADDQRL